MLEWRWKLPASSRYIFLGEIKRLDLRRNQAFHNASGGDKRDRTADLLNAIQALSQLSYTPVGDTLLFNCKGLQVLQVLKRGGWLNMTRAPS